MEQPDVQALLERRRSGTAGKWVAVQPRDQAGGVAVAHTGRTWAAEFPTRTSIRVEGTASPGEMSTPPEQAERDADLIADAVNSLEPLCRAVAERDEEITRLRGALHAMWELVGPVANECGPCDLPPEEGGPLYPASETLRGWEQRLSQACSVAREALRADATVELLVAFARGAGVDWRDDQAMTSALDRLMADHARLTAENARLTAELKAAREGSQ